ncbi:MAG: 3-isopropylmalate dehydrogenase [Pseudomonadota bacterium]
MTATVLLLPGDGIGPEVTAAARRVLEHCITAGVLDVRIDEALVGGAAIDDCGDPLPPATVAACRDADAVLLGAVGGPKWSDPSRTVRPEQGLLALRRALGVYANLRPVRTIPALANASPLRAERLQGTDLLVVRELTGGIYFGAKERTATSASDECKYTVAEIERIVRVAARLASSRRGQLTSVDKANVLETSRLWRETTERVVHDEFPKLTLEHVLVDAAAMHLLSRPASFDVIVTENMFGDILTDEASMLAGSLGLLPSASLGDDGPGLYEPIHGSAPDIAGQGIANPCGTIASLAMACRHNLKAPTVAEAIETAIEAAVSSGVRTADIADGDPAATTVELTDAIIGRLSLSQR